MDLKTHVIYGNPLTDWVAAGSVAAAVWTVLLIVRGFMASRHRRQDAAQRPTAIRLLLYLIANTRHYFLFALALAAGEQLLVLPGRAQHVVSNAVMLLTLLQIGLWAARSVRFYIEYKEAQAGADRVFAGSMDIIQFVSGILIWSLVILVALENMGVNITALLAGLGVGGVAVALALQNVLGDLFASLSIALDKPFVVGDLLHIDAYVGTVERIGIKTTRLRSDGGEQIILSNADILKSRVRNFGRTPELRTLATIRVPYATPKEQLAAIPQLLEGIVRAQANARFDRCHLKTLGDSSLCFELAYFVQQPKTNSLLDLQQAVNLGIIEEFRRAGIEFAYPSQRILVEREPA